MCEYILGLTIVALKSASGFKIKDKGQMRIQTKPSLGELIVSPKANQRWENNCSFCQCACITLSIAYFISSSDSNGLNLRTTQNFKKIHIFFCRISHRRNCISILNQRWVRVFRGGNVSICCSAPLDSDY